MTLSLVASRQCKTLVVRASSQLRRPTFGASSRRLLSSKPDASFPTPKPESGPPPTLKNIGLATALAGFCGGVFTYSMNAVGKGDAENDPLALLKEEAQEARQSKDNEHKRKLSTEEIAALESGSAKLQVAASASADIAQIEEEANLKVFEQKQGGGEKKKKPWWRFGF